MKDETMYRYQLELNNGKTYVLDSKQDSIAKLTRLSFQNDGCLTVGQDKTGKHEVVRASSVVAIRFVSKVKC